MTLFATAAPLLAAFAEEGDKAKDLSDGGWLAAGAWLIPVVPLVLMFGIVFFGKRMKYKGWELAEASMLFVALYGTVLFIANMAGDGIDYQGSVEIARLGDMVVEWGWTVDGLSIMMYFVVGLVGLLVFTYAKGYMEGDVRYTWFFASFTLFAGAMLVLVSSANLIQLIVGWELVGVASYLLIGHYWEDHENNAAAIKAFLTNKIADVGLFVGAIVIAMTVGSFRFTDILDAVEASDSALMNVAFWAGLALFIGAMGKSAQFPFHVWLPDAMAGPTPVSALMHAATMVTAGVYLLGRMFPLYHVDGFATEVKTIIIIIGGLTLFLTGLIALVQDDIKKVLAYSTLSQLGYMVAAMGAGAYTAGLFHLFTHAFFKALLFLGAGSVIHSVHSNNMSDMGGLRKSMPYTFWTFVIGSLALAGIFPLAGFWSKDEILASIQYDAGHGGGGVATFILILAILGAVVTAFYMTRTVWLTFFGEYKGDAHPHESPKVMTYPLVGLAAFSVFAGWFNIPGVFTGFTDWLAARVHLMGDHHPESLNFGLAAIGLLAAGIGIALGYRLFGPDKPTQAERDSFEIPVLYPILRRRYGIDDLYLAIVRWIRGPLASFINWTNGHIFDFLVNGAGFAGRGLAKIVYGFDQAAVDGVFNASGAGAGAVSTVLRRTQTGKVQTYATAIFGAVVVLVAGFVFLR